MKGLANIPLILSLLLMAVAIPAAIRLSVVNNDTARKAATLPQCLRANESNCFSTPCCAGLTCSLGTCVNKTAFDSTKKVNCGEVRNLYITFCRSASPNRIDTVYPVRKVPCYEISQALSRFCPGTLPR
ncbi:MAG TPA: hypothetical protein VF810_01900 [Patescibacteria group bacterium]